MESTCLLLLALDDLDDAAVAGGGESFIDDLLATHLLFMGLDLRLCVVSSTTSIESSCSME